MKINQIRLLEEQSGLSLLQEQLKNYIFGFLYILQKDSKSNWLFLSILNIIQTLQLHSYMFRPEVASVWLESNITDGINSALSRLLFATYFNSYQSYVVFMGVLAGFGVIGWALVIYLGYTYYNNSYINRTAASILRVIFQIFITALFMPTIQLQINILKCETKNGQQEFLGLQCWSGEHIGYCIIGVISLFILITLFMSVIFTFYECRHNKDDVSARINGRSEAALQFYVVVQEIAFAIMADSNFLYILLGINLGGSIIIFLSFTIDSPYYDVGYKKFNQVLSSVVMWGSLMLILAAAMEGSIVSGTIVAWMFGVPFVVGIIMTQRESYIERLVKNVNKLSSADEIIIQARYILTLMKLQKQQKYAILLDGYIETHKRECDREGCPLKQKKQKNTRLIRNVLELNKELAINEKQALLLMTIYKIYEQGLDKFEKNVDLRIQFSFFLLEIMQYKRKALQELQRAEECDPSLDTQFIIFRYKRIIESEIQDDQNEKQNINHEILPISAAPPIIQGLAKQIDKSSNIHLEYWAELQQDTPDIAKLGVLGQQVIESIQSVQFLWKKLQRVSPNHQPSIILYSMYQSEVLCDKVMSQKLNDKLRIMMNEENITHKIDDIDNHDYSNDQIPTVVLSSDSEKFGCITQLNSSAAGLFGYTRSELLNQKVQKIMPKLYAKQHDQFIESFISANEMRYQQKNRQVFGLTKSSFIFPITLHIKPINSMKSGIAFISTIIQEKTLKYPAYIITDENGGMQGVSSQCIPVLKLDQRYLRNLKYIAQLFPLIMTEKEQYQSKSGNIIEYKVPEAMIRSQKSEGEENVHIYQLQCFCTEINFSTNFSTVGYVFKFDFVYELNTVSAHNSSIISKQEMKKLRPNNLSNQNIKEKENVSKLVLNYNFETKIFEGFYKDILSYSDIGNSRIDESHIQKDNQQNSLKDSMIEQHIQIDDNRIKYDEGIKTVRLFQNRVGEIIQEDEIPVEDDEQEQEGNQYRGQFESALYDENEQVQQQDQEYFQSRHKLESLVNQDVIPIPIKFLRVIEFIITLSMISLSFADYFIDIGEQQNLILSLNSFNTLCQVHSEFQYILENIRDLQIIQSGIYGKNATEITKNVTQIKFQMNHSISLIQSLFNDLTLSQYTFPKELSDLYTIPSIQMQFNSSNAQQEDYQQATSQMLSYALQIMNSDINNITFSSNSIQLYFTLVNGFNAYLAATLKAQTIVMDDFIGMTSYNQSSFIIIIVLGAVVLFLSLSIIIIILTSIRLSKEYVTILFLELPPKVVKNLFIRSESFVKYLSQIEGQGSQKGDDEIDQNIDQEESLPFMLDNSKKKRKKFKNSSQPPIPFYIQVFVLACFMETYFILGLTLSELNLSNVGKTVTEANQTLIEEGFYALSSNTQQAVFIDPSQIIQGATANLQAASNLYKLYQLDSDIHQAHSENIDIYQSVYTNAYNTLMFQNPCQLLNQLNLNISIVDCEQFAAGSIKAGFTVAITRFFENLRSLQSIYVLTIQSPTPSINSIDSTITFYNISSNSTRNLQLNLLKYQQMQEIKIMQRTYFRYLFILFQIKYQFYYIRIALRYLSDMFIQGIQDQQDSYKSRKIGLFIAYILIIVIIYVLFWIPFHQHHLKDIWKARMTLMMIPVENLIRLRNARAYIKTMINKRN